MVRWEFKQAGLNINYVDGIRYLGSYLGPKEELEAWVQPKVEAWSHGVRTLAKTSKRYTQSVYAGLGMSLQIERQYLKKECPWGRIYDGSYVRCPKRGLLH